MSGANSTPLGRMNPAIGSGMKRLGSSLLKPSYLGGIPPSSSNPQSYSSATTIAKLDHYDSNSNASSDSPTERKKRRKSRWQGSDKEKTFIPGMPTVLPSNMNRDQEEAYLLQLQIEELSRRLRSNDLGIPPNPEDRSPSPEPIYNNEGKRLNTREYRTRKKLEDDRHTIIMKMQNLNPEYKPPADYKPPVVKVSDKVMIPQEEHPDINFVGLLIGPRGNTLKSMEKDTGAKIIIRGKGSVKEGKVGRKDGGPMPGEDEPLHAYVTASNPEAVKRAVDRINEIIRQGVEVPEGQNDLRRMQLRELALLNGTLRENDGPRCTNCGSTAHKLWQCPDKPNVTNSVICSSCGGAGHIAKDCRQRKPGHSAGQAVDRQKIDEEYMSLMAELGEGPPNNNKMNESHGANNSPQIRSLFDTPTGPPRAIMAPPPPSSNGPPQNNHNVRPNNNNAPLNNMGPPIRNQQGGNDGNWSGPPNGNQQQFNRQTNRLVLGGSGNNNQQQQPFNRPPPMNWQGGQNQTGGFNQGPPPNLLNQPPPPPPPVSSNQQQPSNQPQAQWINQGGPPGMNWQGGPPQSMGCPPPGPVPAPRPVGPPPAAWGWNGPQMGPPGTGNMVPTGANSMGPPGANNMGPPGANNMTSPGANNMISPGANNMVPPGGNTMAPPGANMGSGGPPTGKQMDLGAFLWNSTPPPPPPPPASN